MILGVTAARATWHVDDCKALNTVHGEMGVFSTLISDFVFLILMLFGLLRWKSREERGGLWWFLYTQVVTSSTLSSTLTEVCTGLGVDCVGHTC
jgi:hypothetical protein